MNSTLNRFGYPATLVSESDHWVVLLRPGQVTLGSLILGAKSEATQFSDLPTPAFAELGEVVARIERVLGTRFAYEKINYLMLMMVDPHVHFHVIPRYSAAREFGAVEFADAGWPGPPDLASVAALDESGIERLVDELRQAFEHA